MDSDRKQLHIFIFPLMAAGHMLPAADIASLFAAQGVRVYIVTTAGNAPAIEAAVRPSARSGRCIEILIVEWPSSNVSLPDNLSSVSSANMHMDFLVSTAALRPSFERLVKQHRPAAMITDMFYPWTAEIAEEMGIPRLVFHGSSFFSLCVRDKPLPGSGSFVVPDIPHRIEFSRSQLPDLKKMRPDFAELFVKINEAEAKNYGVVVNSFYELEPDYADHYRKVMGRKAWHIGPVFLHNDITTDISLRGDQAADNQARILKWLDSKPASSVLYVCFGSLSRFAKSHLKEIAMGLEASGFPFIWVVRSTEAGHPSDQWLPEGFEERTAECGMGMVIKGWAPQLLILNHKAIGGFLTHCGWNSSLESIAAGLPVLTWPLFADQFQNEKLLVDVLKIGIEIGVKSLSIDEDKRAGAKAEDIAAAVVRLMGEASEAEEMRRRARQLKAAARRAVEEGGSSRRELRSLTQELLEKQWASSHVKT